MKRFLTIWVIFILASMLIACSPKNEKTSMKQLSTQADKIGYALGLDMGKRLNTIKDEINIAAFNQGVLDSFEGKTPLLSEEQIKEIKTAFSKKMMAEREANRKELAEKNKTQGEKFLAENAKKDGVRATQSGLQYQVISEGSGNKPTLADRVTVNYKGTLLDGTEFDSSYKRGKPASFSLRGVIKGWTEGLQLMSVGSKYRFFIPPELAYGEVGAGKAIGPNQTLIFDVELISIEKSK